MERVLDNPKPMTQNDLSNQMGITIDQLQRYKQLLNLVPELQELVEKDKLRPTVAHKIIAKLPQKEQEDITCLTLCISDSRASIV